MSFIQSLYTFITKTKVPSGKMNENFSAIKDAVNDNYSKISQNTSDITSLSTTVASHTQSIYDINYWINTGAFHDYVIQIGTAISDMQSAIGSLSTTSATLSANAVTFPEYTNGSLLVNNGSITAPCKGWVLFRDINDSTTGEMRLQGSRNGVAFNHLIGRNTFGMGYYIDDNSCFIPVQTGDVASNSGLVQFFPCI